MMDIAEARASAFKRLCEIIKDTSSMEKVGVNKEQGYKFVREADIKATLRTKMAEKGLMLTPNVEESSSEPYVNPKTGSASTTTTVKAKYTLWDAESGLDVLTFSMPGSARDTGDKGIYKALTGSLKYALTELFMIPTYDDPENDDPTQQPESPEKSEPKAETKADPTDSWSEIEV